MVLAGAGDYLRSWQWPFLAAFLATWLIGGPYLTRRALAKTDLPRSRRRLGSCSQLNFLANAAGLVAMGVVALLFIALAKKPTRRWLVLVGFTLGPAAMLGMSWVVHLVMLDLPGRDVRRVVLRSVGPLVLAMLVLLAAAFVPARVIRLREAGMAECQGRLRAIHRAAEKYFRHLHPGTPAPSLQALVEAKLLTESQLTCSGRGPGEPGYLYAPAPLVEFGKAGNRLLACDRRGNHTGFLRDRRLVLLTDGQTRCLDEGDFQKLLALDENQPIREADQADRSD